MLALFIAITVERVPQSDFKRLEPGLEILPLIETLAIDGLANLLGARGSHASHRLMELDALRFKFEAAEFQNAAHIALEVVDHVLVMYPQNPAGQHVIPMPHEFQIRTVVACDVVDAVGELLALREQLLQIAE